MMVPATIVCAIACLVLVYAEYRKARRLRIVAKVIASGAFIVVGMAAVDPHLVHAFKWAAKNQFEILMGLVLGAVGDVFLLGSSKRAFMAGLVAFLFGHIFYVLAGRTNLPAELEWNEWVKIGSPYTLIPIVVGLAMLVYLWRRLGSMRVPVIFYVIVIVAMVVVAIDATHGDWADKTRTTRFLEGAVLFFVSDIAVARDKFVDKSFTNRAWGLPAYYAGQLFIAWSLF